MAVANTSVKVTDNMQASSPLSTRLASFAHVRFCNVPETYTSGSDVECTYVISDKVEVSSRDWVGLYKVGWRAVSDYIYYMWSPLPADSVPGQEVANRVTFPGSRLPKDDGEFYQFCYVTGAGQVRGASTPFQFKYLITDDLIEIEDENGELLVIRTKTAVLEDQLQKASELCIEMKQKLQTLEDEKSQLAISAQDLEKKVQLKTEENLLLQEKLKQVTEKLTDTHQEARDLQTCIQSLQEKVEVLNQEKLSMEKRLDDNDIYISSLQDKIKTLVTDKDALVGKTKALEEEKEMYLGRSTTSDNQLQHYMSECEKLSTKLFEAEASVASLKTDIERMESELAEQRLKYTRYIASTSVVKDSMADLHENLRNAEDKLEAAEHCKKMLNEEVLTLKQAWEKISSDVEAAKVEADSNKSLVVMLTKDKLAKEHELEEMTEELKKKDQEMREMDQSHSSAMFALQSAQSVLNNRFSKLQKKCDEMEDKLKKAEAKVKQLEKNEVRHQCDMTEMKYRLKMGCEEYQKIHIERDQLLDELKQQNGNARASSAKEGSLSVTEADLMRQFGDIQTELDKRHDKINKYKRLYADMKKKYEIVTNQLKEAQKQTTPQPMLPSVPKSPVLAPNCKGRSSSSSESERTPEKQKSTDEEAKQKQRETIKSFDPLVTDERRGDLSPPLKPLPPPIQPKILPSAKVAAVKASSGLLFATGPADIEPVLATEDEKFVDALSEPQLLCSHCRFPCATNDDLATHMLAAHHFWVCPMCDKEFLEGTEQIEFEMHVNSHFQ